MIKIVDVGYQFVNVGGFDVKRVNGSGDYLFLMFRCPTEVWIGDGYKLLPENTFFLFEKGAPQIYRKLDGHFINDWIHFEIEPYDSFFENLGIPFRTPIVLSDRRNISEMISDLFIEYFSVGEQHEKIMDQIATAMFLKFSDLYSCSEKNSGNKAKYLEKLVDIRRRIQNFEYWPDGVQELSKLLNISPSYLQHLYKDFFGVSVGQDLINAKIDYASYLLNSTSNTIAEIAQMCGYETIEHFSRQFKKVKGCAPSKFRE